MIVLGGFGDSRPLSTVEKYDVNGNLETLPSMNIARYILNLNTDTVHEIE